ncbi:MAG: 2-amino-4-hydroxy-6-hydroxymethyldihydropteridine diphosphokinase [Gammaproteobacteria bacterium]
MPRVFVGIGSNHERERHIALALDALEKHFGALQVSPVYSSAAVRSAGADYFNLVVGFDCEQPPADIFATLKAIERSAGRDRSGAECVLDLDLLAVGDIVTIADGFELPRRDILEHAFVLQPLADLAPTVLHPVAEQSYGALWQTMAPHAPALVHVVGAPQET